MGWRGGGRADEHWIFKSFGCGLSCGVAGADSAGGSESGGVRAGGGVARAELVFSLSNTSEPGVHEGVECVRWRREADLLWPLGLDVAIVIRITGRGKRSGKASRTAGGTGRCGARTT